MATIIPPSLDDLATDYSGFDTLTVGAGTDPDMYASPAYAKKKTQSLYIGSLSDVVYGGFDHDPNPTALVLHHISQYNVVLAINIHYLPVKIRLAVLQYVLRSNQNRIRDGLPIMIDWHALKRAVPPVAGATRMYKLTLLRVKERIPLVEWEDVARKSGLQWQGHWKKTLKSKR